MLHEQSTLEAVAAIVESISGVSVHDLSAGTDLLDLGLDSLMFVRIGRVLENRYKVSISMKRFYDELSNLGALSAFLAAHGAPQDGATHNPGTQPKTPVAITTPALVPVLRQAVPLKLAPASSLPDRSVRSQAGVDTVMLAHMALMRRYLGGVAAESPQTLPPADTVAVQPVTHRPTAPGADRSDAIETRKKFSGIVTSKEALTPQQRDFIAGLSGRLSSRCALSKTMAEGGKAHLSDWKYSLQFKQDLKELRFPIVCETAGGSRFIDVDGNEYIDIAMGMGVHYFGHSPGFVDDAVRAQLDKNLALGPQSRMAPDVAARICALTGHERAAFFVTGSDAVMLALRLVRAARARDKVVLFAGAYHGICSDILAGQGESGAVPMSPGLPPGSVNDLVVLDYDAPESLDTIRAMADQLAGVLVEPVQSRNPALQPQRFLRQLRSLCTELQIPLIFDEMVNGFRQAAGGMQEWFGVKADLSTYGKIIGGGYPLSVIAGNAALMQWIDGGVWHYGDDSSPLADSIATGGTHNKHPVALAAASAVLDHIERNPQLFHEARMRMYRLADRTNVWFEKNAVPLRLTYFGTQFKFESFAPALELELFFYLLLEQGIYTWELHVANLSTEHTLDDIDKLFSAIVHAVEALRAGGFSFRAEKLRRQYLPMSSVQKRLYAITQREGAEKPYHLAGAWRLGGNVDTARLEDCIHQVIIRHEALRTAFVVVDGEFYQRIVAEPRFFLDRIVAGTQSVDALLDEYIQPFNLLEPPLIRVGLAATADGAYLLLMDVHHIAADGLSMNIVLQEMMALYDGRNLDPVRSQARHVQETVAQYLAGERARADERYWLDTLAPLVAAQDRFDLSPDFNRPVVTSFAGQRLGMKLDSAATLALHDFCKQERVSTFAALFAVFVAWVWRYARQQDFVVGLPGSGRPDDKADAAVGMFVNTLTFPAHVDPQSEVATFLHQVRDTLFDAQEHGDYPFSALLSALNTGHRNNRNPLFDVMFSYENAGAREIRTAAFVGETLTQYEGAGMFDLSLDLIEAENIILINCAYAESLFAKATMELRLAEYMALLEALVTRSAGSVEEWVSGVSAGNPGTPADSAPRGPALMPGAAETVWALWTKQLARDDRRIALVERNRRLSYAELDLLLNKVAFTLFNRYGVRAGDRVIVSLDSSIDLVVAMLALFSMGAVYVPVTPETPPVRAGAIQRQCNAQFFVHAGDSPLLAELAVIDTVECIVLAQVYEAAESLQKHQTLLPPRAADLAYVIFTSGSTGTPKGVEVLHAGIANSVAWRIHQYAMGPSDTTLQMPSAAFDASIIDILSALLSGGTLVMLETASKRSLEQVSACIEQNRVTSMLLTPTLYRVILERIPAAVRTLRFVTLAGEKLPPDLMSQHFATAGAVALWNEYGPTECSVVVSGCRLTPAHDRVTIGWPLPHTQVHILDEREQAVPDGVWGRLWVSGVGLARGYAGDESGTQAKFRTLPALGNLRCYDTGDIARILGTGELEFRGRDDSQVKVNGYRVELEEVEAAMRSQLQLTQVAVALMDKGTSASLHGWVVADAVPPNWRDALLAILPAWMVPAVLHAIDRLPLLPSGKLNRAALVPSAPASDHTRAVEPLPAEGKVAQLLHHCRGVLGRRELQLSDNYFDAGGDSIQAIVLASRLNDAGYVLDVNDLFRYPVLGMLGQRIKEKTTQSQRLVPADTANLPTPMQLWFFDACKGDTDTFTQAAWLRLPREMTLPQLDLMCRHFVAEHPVFDDVPALMATRTGVSAVGSVGPHRVRCTEHVAGEDIDALTLAARADINLRTGLLMRVLLVRQQDQHTALVVFHHFVVDAVSWQLLQVQMAQLWDDVQQGRALRRMPENATVRQFASELHSETVLRHVLQEVPFWQSMLKPAGTALLKPLPASSMRLHRSAQLDSAVAEVLLASGHARFRTRGGDLLLAAFTDAIAGLYKLDAVTVLIESNGRAQRHVDADFSRTFGWMTSAYPLRIDTAANMRDGDWAARIERLRDTVQRVPEQGVGYGVLRHIVRHNALEAGSPEFAFNYLGRFQHTQDHDFAMLDETAVGDQLGELGLLPPVELVCFADDAGLHISLSADSGCVPGAMLDAILQAFQRQALDLAETCRAGGTAVSVAPVDFLDGDWALDDYLALLHANSIDRARVDNLVPLTPMQRGLVFHARKSPQDLAYLEQVDFTLEGVESARLAMAFQHLLDEFPLLRAAFITGRNGRSAQIIQHDVMLPVVSTDISKLPHDEQQKVIAAAREADQKVPFDLARAPLMRVQLFTLKTAAAGKAGSVHVIWAHHHLIMDGWCVGILYERLLKCYAITGAPSAGNSPAVSPRVPADFNQDYFSWLMTRDKAAAIAHWARTLAGVELPPRLAPWPRHQSERFDTAVRGYELQKHETLLPATLTAAMQSFGAARNATLSSVIRLVWGVLLARFTNTIDVVFGTVVSGRPPEVAGIERAVGLFINTIPVRFQLEPGLTAEAAIALVQEQANSGRQHEYLSLAEIQAAAPQLQAREALFDHLIVLENYPMDAALRGTAAVPDVHDAIRIANIQAFERTDLPLNLILVPSAEGLTASFLFDAAIYPVRQIKHLAEHFVHLAELIVQAPDQALSTLDLLTPQERLWLFDEWNQRQASYPDTSSLFDLWCQAATQHGDRIALHDESGTLTHAQLHTRVQEVAAGLLGDAAFAAGCRVALWLPRNRDMIVGMLAVLAAGACYVPLDPVYPEDRLRFIVKDSGAALVLTSEHMPALTGDLHCVDIHRLPAVTGVPKALPRVTPEAAAYVIYTSGSTGQPKGCAISHRNVVRLLRNDAFDFDFGHEDVWVLAHSFCFDFSVWEMYGALVHGGSLVIPAAAQVRNTEAFVQLVARHRVTVLNQTPAAFYQFARAALKLPVADLAALRLVVFGGDSLASNRLASWVAAFPSSKVKLVNMYGITETTVHVSYRELGEADVHEHSSLNMVGRPLPETHVWIVDRNGQLQPPGITGEIVVGGSGVGMGYLNRPELTARKFAVLDAAGGERCYWSGDVGCISPELELVYLGRNDHQVQVRGFRVECEEVARCYERHQSVDAALVLPVDNAHGTELVVYLVGDETGAPAQWRAWLQSRLPEYMIPSHTIWLKTFPLTGNGKIDRAALPNPLDVAVATQITTTTADEDRIIAVWKEVLEHEQVGPITNFFDIGGHSLKALTLADVLRERLGYNINVGDIFEFPTPRQQAARCRQGAGLVEADTLADLVNDIGLDELEALLAGMPDTREGA